MARPSNQHERRDAIVTGLLRAMAERGYAKASIQVIAKEANLSPGLVHYHFANKQEILLALVTRLRSQVGLRYERRAKGTDDPWKRMRAYIDAHLALGDDDDARAVACWVAIGAEALRQPEVLALYRTTIAEELKTLTVLVRDVLRAEGRATRNARALAAGVLSSIQGAYTLGAVADVAPRGFASPTVWRMTQGLLSAAGERA